MKKVIFNVMRKCQILLIALFVANFISAQVQVKDEPRHHNVFENEFVRILDVHLGPKDTTQYHLHNTPSVFILLTNTRTGSQHAGQQPQKGVNLTGVTTYDDLKTPRIHRVWNEDTSWFHVMDVELTAGQPKHKVELVSDEASQILLNQPLVNGYRIKPGKEFAIKLPVSAAGYLFISLGNAVIDVNIRNHAMHQKMKSGHYVWLDGIEPIAITGTSTAGFILLQLK